MKLKNVVLLVVSGALAVLLSGCGAKDCPTDLDDQVEKAIGSAVVEAKGKSQEEIKKICLAKVEQFRKYDGCKLAEKDKDGTAIERKDEKGNKITHFSIKQGENFCNK